MLNKIVSWWNRVWTPVPVQTVQEMHQLLKDRSSAEIAARLLRRAELFESGSDDFLKRCAALDRVAAERIHRVTLNDPTQDVSKWLDARDLCLRLLREGSN
jgi:hypothetical protein